MLSLNHITVEFSSRPVLDDISFLVNRRDKIALVGKNGAGKSTLLKVIARLQPLTSGSIAMSNDITIGYLPQQMIHTNDTNVIEEARKAFAHINDIQRRIDRIQTQLSTRTDYESQDYHELADQLSILNIQLSTFDSRNIDGEIEKTLIGLGFERSDFSRPCSEFSGGWRMRIELAKILLQQPDLLLLDEPTNHLDIESIQWFEHFLANSRSAVLLVSHDRAVLDNVTNRTIEISLGHIYDYNVNYSHYVELRKERREQQIRAYENQQKMIQETEDFIERFRYKATKAVQVQSRIKQLEKLERLEIDREDTSRLRLRFPPAPRSGDYPVMADDVGKSFGNHIVFEHVNFTLKRGEKVAFVGRNGEGKTTFVKCIMGQLEHEGSIRIGHNVKIGYFAQNQASLLDENLTVFQTIDNVATGDIRTKIRDLLGAFMFGGEASDKKVKVLSGGERSRLAMIRLLLEPVNLLILDEPTNHLDMQSKDILKEALLKFDGTLIIVSHDRYFLDGLVDKIYVFGHQRMREHIGSIYDYLEDNAASYRSALSTDSGESARTETIPPAVSQSRQKSGVSGHHSASKQEFLANKQRNSLQRKLEKQIADIENEIAELEQQLKQMEGEMATPQGAADAQLAQRYQQTMNTLNDKMFTWEELSNQM